MEITKYNMGADYQYMPRFRFTQSDKDGGISYIIINIYSIPHPITRPISKIVFDIKNDNSRHGIFTIQTQELHLENHWIDIAYYVSPEILAQWRASQDPKAEISKEFSKTLMLHETINIETPNEIGYFKFSYPTAIDGSIRLDNIKIYGVD